MSRRAAAAALAVVAAGWAPGGGAGASPAGPVSETVTVYPARVLDRFRPDRALGAGVDGQDHGEVARIYTPATLRAMASTGLSPLTYRLRTELGIEAWHWNPRGTWSDPGHHRGYWTSRASGGPISVSYGYRLPRRGDTIDQAADNDYSRLDDGREQTFWKSNPYLDPHFTGQLESAHPQWVLADLYGRRAVDAIRIDWGTPYATRFRVQWWDGPSAIALVGHPGGHWVDFASGGSVGGRGGRQVVRLADRARVVRFVRVVLERSSHTAPPGSRDVRDRLGFAIRELHVGRLGARGLVDYVRHAPSGNHQTVTMASSTDPWHRAADLDVHTEQPGLDRVWRSGLGRGRPLMVPVAVLYGTPADATAEIRYLRRRAIPFSRVELGEEPDGQLASPEDYATLYREYASAVRRVDPHVALGGPGYQTAIPDWQAWPDASGERSWTRRFVSALAAQGASRELGFFSFEWYPFDNTCLPTRPQLAGHARTLADVIARQRADGLPASVPMVISEYGYSAFAGQAEVSMPGALLNADVVGQFLSAGGSTAFLYGYEPNELGTEVQGCQSWGNLTLFQSDARRRIVHPTAAYWGARLQTGAWVSPGDGVHRLVASAVSAPSGAPTIRAYPVVRPDGRVAVLALNLDPVRAARLTVAGLPRGGPLDVWSLSAREYAWHPHGPRGYPAPDRAPSRSQLPAGSPVTLAPYSMAVVRAG